MRHGSYRGLKGLGKKLIFPSMPEESPLACSQSVGTRVHSSNMEPQTKHAEQPSPSQLGLADVLAAIANCQASITTLTNKVDAIQLDVGLIRQDMDKIRSRLTTAE